MDLLSLVESNKFIVGISMILMNI
jgi:hypothetical protein